RRRHRARAGAGPLRRPRGPGLPAAGRPRRHVRRRGGDRQERPVRPARGQAHPAHRPRPHDRPVAADPPVPRGRRRRGRRRPGPRSPRAVRGTPGGRGPRPRARRAGPAERGAPAGLRRPGAMGRHCGPDGGPTMSLIARRAAAPHRSRRTSLPAAGPSPDTVPATSPTARRTVAPSRYDAVASASAAVVIRAYSTSFGWACRLLAEPEREHVRNVYALVRVADEIVDEPDPTWPADDRGRLLTALEEDVYSALHTGRSANLVVHAFARTARRYGIGRDLIAPFLASMRADLSVSRHDAADTRLVPGAVRLGAAFQKVNCLRDLAEDHDALGRTYFPGLDPATFGDAHRDTLLAAIDADLAAAERALVQLPPGSRRAVR